MFHHHHHHHQCPPPSRSRGNEVKTQPIHSRPKASAILEMWMEGNPSKGFLSKGNLGKPRKLVAPNTTPSCLRICGGKSFFFGVFHTFELQIVRRRTLEGRICGIFEMALMAMYTWLCYYVQTKTRKKHRTTSLNASHLLSLNNKSRSTTAQIKVSKELQGIPCRELPYSTLEKGKTSIVDMLQ